MSDYILISDAAKEVQVESHVLRYWEEELKLPIKRNELGHRYYTREDVERFRQIKDLKERGFQLKAIRGILRDGKLEEVNRQGWSWGKDPEELESVRRRVLEREQAMLHVGKEQEEDIEDKAPTMAIEILESRELGATKQEAEEKSPAVIGEEKARKIQFLLRQIIQETVRESGEEFCKVIKDSVLKELDYQFRLQEERLEERDQRQIMRNEEYYHKMDELLREKSGRDIKKALPFGNAFLSKIMEKR